MIKSKEPFDPDEENMAEKFSGNALTCLNSLLFFGFIIFLIYLLFVATKAEFRDQLVKLTGLALLLYLLIGLQMFYFKVSSGYLIVRNHYLPWIHWHYKLEDIGNISIKKYDRLSRSLRISIKNRRNSRIFPAGSLRDEDWTALKIRLEQAALAVKD